jgi:hypothetical protein
VVIGETSADHRSTSGEELLREEDLVALLTSLLASPGNLHKPDVMKHRRIIAGHGQQASVGDLTLMLGSTSEPTKGPGPASRVLREKSEQKFTIR